MAATLLLIVVAAQLILVVVVNVMLVIASMVASVTMPAKIAAAHLLARLFVRQSSVHPFANLPADAPLPTAAVVIVIIVSTTMHVAMQRAAAVHQLAIAAVLFPAAAECNRVVAM